MKYSTKVSKYRQNVDELNIGFDFLNGFKCSDMHRFEMIKNLFINKFEINFYQDQKDWKHQLIATNFIAND